MLKKTVLLMRRFICSASIVFAFARCVWSQILPVECQGNADQLEIVIEKDAYLMRCSKRWADGLGQEVIFRNSVLDAVFTNVQPPLESLSFISGREYSHPMIDVSKLALQHAQSLRYLTFEGVYFADSMLRLKLPRFIQLLKISDTNIRDLEFDRWVPTSKVKITLDVTFPNVPTFLRHPILPQTMEIDRIRFEAGGMTTVTKEAYEIVMKNLRELNLLSSVEFIPNCGLRKSESIAAYGLHNKHVICYEYPAMRIASRRLEYVVVREESGNSNTTSVVLTVMGVIACIIGIALAVFVVKRLFRRETKTLRPETETTTEELLLHKESLSTHIEESVDLIELPTTDITMSKCISPNNIWLGEMDSRRIVLKRVEAEYNTESATNALIKYSKQIALLTHENVVSMIGIAWIAGTDYTVITEYLEQGTLSSVLIDPEYKMKSKHKLSMSLDIAQALAYLHADQQNAYVRQFSSRTVLVNDSNVCKVSLFHCISCSKSVFLSVGTNEESFGTGDIPYSAPELLLQAYNVSPRKANVYAFGIILGEIWTRAKPFRSLVDKLGGTLSDLYVLNKLRKGEIVAPFDDEPSLLTSPQEYRDLMNACLSKDPKARPTAEEIVARLQQIKSACS